MNVLQTRRTATQENTARMGRVRPVKSIIGAFVVIGWVGIIFMFLGLADPPGPNPADRVPGDGLILLAGHLFLFSVLGLLVSAEILLVRNSRSLMVALASGLLVGVTLALFTEWYQSNVSGRSGNVGDVLTDVVGAAAGALLAWLVRTKTAGGRSRAAH